MVVLTIPLTACATETFRALGAAGSLGSAYFDYTAKEKGEPQIVTPDIEDYSDGVQALAADELDRLGPPWAGRISSRTARSCIGWSSTMAICAAELGQPGTTDA